jgi:hypothetical protein
MVRLRRLCAEVVDVGDFDIVDGIEILRRCAAPDDEIIPAVLHLGDSGKDGYGPQDVFKASRRASYLFV